MRLFRDSQIGNSAATPPAQNGSIGDCLLARGISDCSPELDLSLAPGTSRLDEALLPEPQP
jgi:hypothetical protein